MHARIRLSLFIASALAACSPDVTSSVDVHNDLEVRDTILVPVADVPSTTPETIDDTGPTDTDQPVDTSPVDTGPEDTALTDTGPTDTGLLDTGSDDTALADTSPDDTGPDDTGPDDTGPADTGPDDTGPDDTGPDDVPVVDPDPYAPGTLGYDRVTNIIATDDLFHVRWHPSGDFALILNRPNKVLRYDAATRELTSLGTLGTSLADLDVGDEGTFVIVGKDGTQAALWTATWNADDGFVTARTTLPTGTPQVVTVEPAAFRPDLKDPSRFVIGASGSTHSISYLYLFDIESGLSPVKGFNTTGGLFDLMWGLPALQGGSPNVVTAEGVNGIGSQTWVIASDLVVSNGWSGGFGNAGGAHWRPDGSYGIVCGWSSNKLYVYDGAWELATLPMVPNGASPNAVRWRDHRRALVVGRVIATPPYAVVIDIRAGESADWPATMVDQSIKNFDASPWFGNNSAMHLLDADWRPHVACDEGLIVGTDAASSGAASFGFAIRFHDASDPACTP